MSLNYFLYRAVACVRQEDTGPDWPEMHVFFEAPAGVRPIVELSELLLFAWNVPADSVVAYNIWSEEELLTELAFGGAASGDARLFETGCVDGQVLYAKPARTQMFVSPPMHARLVAAQALVVDELAARQRRQVLRTTRSLLQAAPL